MSADLGPNSGAQGIFERRTPGGGKENAIEAAAPELGRLLPPPFELGILQPLPDVLAGQRSSQPVESRFFPDVADLWPRTGGTDDSPDAKARLLAILLGHR